MPGAKHVILIDDDVALTRLLRKELERHRFKVSIAASGAAGLTRVAEGGIDVVVLDHHLPDQDGLHVLAAIQQLPEAPPVIYLTASAEASVAVGALRAGAADYVVKDVSGDFRTLLLHALGSAIAAAATRRAKEAAEAEVRVAHDRFKALAEERALLMREESSLRQQPGDCCLDAATARLPGATSRGERGPERRRGTYPGGRPGPPPPLYVGRHSIGIARAVSEILDRRLAAIH
jgi:DNA-binding response OmpR family regulator